MKKFLSFLVIASCFFGGFAVASNGAPVPSPDELSQAAAVALEALRGGAYAEGALLALVALVALLRRHGGQRWPWLAGDVGGTLLALVAGSSAALAAGLAAGEPLSASLAYTGLKAGLLAAGGYTAVKRLGGALLKKLPLPGWARGALEAVLLTAGAFFGKPKAVKEAEAAGKAAIEAKPGAGVGPTSTLP